MVDLALKTLLHDKLRFAITIAGVGFAVMLVFVQAGLFAGLLDNATVTIEHADADLWVTAHNTPNVDFAHVFPEEYVNRVRAIPGVARADNLIVQFMYIDLPNGAQESMLGYALDDFKAWNLPWDVTAGNVEDLRRGQFILLDESAMRRFGKFSVGEYREVMGNRLKIIGTTRGALSFSTTPIGFMNFHLAQDLQANVLANMTHYILVKLTPTADTAAVRAEMKRRLPYNDIYSKREWSEQTTRYWLESTGLGLNMYLTVFLGCLIGVIVVALTLYTSTMEHLKEFGTVKAIGGSNGDIYRILMRQALVAAIFGFILGIIPSYALRPAFASIHLKLIIPPTLVGFVALGTVILCLGASMLSFGKVAKIDPALVFR